MKKEFIHILNFSVFLPGWGRTGEKWGLETVSELGLGLVLLCNPWNGWGCVHLLGDIQEERVGVEVELVSALTHQS